MASSGTLPDTATHGMAEKTRWRMRAVLMALLIPVALARLPEPCQQHGPPFAWRTKAHNIAFEGRRLPPPATRCQLVQA